MMFLGGVSATLIYVIITVGSHMHEWMNAEFAYQSSLKVFPNEWYTQDLYLIGAVINLFFAALFVLPVM